MAARWRHGLTAREETQAARARSIEMVCLHARRRQDDIDDGYITPKLAGFMMQQYGMGVLDAFTELYGERAAEPLRRAVEQQIRAVDPDYSAHAEARRGRRPANLA